MNGGIRRCQAMVDRLTPAQFAARMKKRARRLERPRRPHVPVVVGFYSWWATQTYWKPGFSTHRRRRREGEPTINHWRRRMTAALGAVRRRRSPRKV